MSYTVEKIASNKVKLSFVESAESFDAAVEKAYLKDRSKINVPGFRKGKAPRKLIENMYGEGVFYDDAFELVAQPAYEEAIKAENLQVVDRPQVDVQQIGAGQELKYTLEVFVKPDVTLGEYKGVAVEKNVEKVTDEAVDARIQNDVERASTTQDVTDRAVENGDIVNLDYAGSVDGVAFEGGTAQGQSLTIGSGMFIPGFEEQMVGMNVGEEKDLNVKFPDEYHSDELKGKDAVFHVKVHAIRTKELPEIDDELAKDVSDFDTMEQFRAHKREELEEKAKQEAKINKENEVVAKAVENATVDIPEVMIERQMDRMLNDIRYRLSMQGISLEDYCKFTGTTMDAMKAEMKGDAERRVKTQLVLDAIVKAEDIKADPEAVEKKLDEYCAQFGDRAAEFKEKLSEDDKAYFEDQAVLDKTLEMLCDSAVEK